MLSKKMLIYLYIAIGVVVAGVALKFLFPALLPFMIALVFSFIMEPIIRVMQEKGRLPRGLATFLSMIIVFGIIGLVLVVILLKLIAELIHLSTTLPGMANNLLDYYQETIDGAADLYITLPTAVTSSIENSITTVADNLRGMVVGTVEGILHLMAMLPSTILLLLVSAIATYFLTRDRSNIARMLLDLIPSPWDEKVAQVLRDIVAGFINFAKAQLMLMTITVIISVSGLYIIGSEYALTIGLLAGFLDLLPIVGPALIYLPWIVWSFTSGDATFAVKLIILYCVLAGVRQTLEAKVVSVNLGLNPLATLIAMYAGLKLIGVIGLLLGPILLIAIKAVQKSGVLSFEK